MKKKSSPATSVDKFSEMLLDHPANMLLVMLVLSWSLLGFSTLRNLPEGKDETRESGAVLGEATQDTYQEALKKLISQYVMTRAELDVAGAAQDTLRIWLSFNQETENKLLSLRVPKKWQELHLLLAIALAREQTGVKKLLAEDESGQADLERARNDFYNILRDYPWLDWGLPR